MAKLSISNKLIFLLTICLFSSFIILVKSNIGAITMAAILAVMLLVLFISNGKLDIYFKSYHKYALIFIAFTFMSAVWSVKRGDTIIRGTTLCEVLICMSVIMMCYQNMPNKTKVLLQVVRWSGFVVAVYSIFYYGLDNIIYILQTMDRMGNEYANINSIGMLSAISVVAWFDLALLDKLDGRRILRLDALSNIPCFLIVAGSGSRKAIVIIALGFFFNIILQNIGNKNFLKIAWKIIVAAIMLYILIRIVMSLEIFGTTVDRMSGLIGALLGTDKADSSALTRLRMIEIGIEQFKKTPILGIGIGGASSLTINGTYLHNNFVEILVGGGIIGFLCYYSKYIYLLIVYWKNRKFWNKETAAIFSLLLIILIMDYGAVTYYSKETSFYLMLFFIESESICIKKK